MKLHLLPSVKRPRVPPLQPPSCPFRYSSPAVDVVIKAIPWLACNQHQGEHFSSRTPSYMCSFLNPIEFFFFYFSSPCLSPGSLPSYLLQNSRLATIKKEENWVHHWMWALALFPLPLDPVCVLLFTLSCNGGFRCFGCCCQALKAEWYKCEVKRILRSLTAIADKAGNSPAHTKQLLLWTGSRDVLWCILGLT